MNRTNSKIVKQWRARQKTRSSSG